MLIKYSAPFRGVSGYASFAKGFVQAMEAAGIEVIVEQIITGRPVVPLVERRYHARRARLKGRTPDVKIINSVPGYFANRRERGCINIGFTMFEASRVPASWVEQCNRMDALLVPCEWNREVFVESGVHVPVRVASPGFERLRGGAERHDGTVAEANTGAVDQLLAPYRGAFKFYSIFQWNERKNPVGLLRAYFAEFHGQNDVCLVLKTYQDEFRNRHFASCEHRRLRSLVEAVRRSMNLTQFPPVALMVGRFASSEIRELHDAGDCFVLPHRAEGWGMPHMAAMAHGKPVITTGYSGNMDFMNRDTAWLLPYQLTPVFNMQHSCYEGDMLWAEPDLHALRQTMRHAYEHPEDGRQLGVRARAHIEEHYGWDARIRHLLREILSLSRGREVVPDVPELVTH